MTEKNTCNTWKPLFPVLRDGYRHNRDYLRPALNSEAYEINRKTGKKSGTVYTLINILVNGGNHDSYILQNVKTGKIHAATIIYSYAENIQESEK